jgi:hypothetical protein
MEPTYKAGDVLLGLRWFRLKVGQVVIAFTDRPVVKRLTKITAEGYWLEGDNKQASSDSRQFGAVQRDQIVALVIASLGRGSRDE